MDGHSQKFYLLVVIDTIVSFQSGKTLKFLLVLGCTTSAAEA